MTPKKDASFATQNESTKSIKATIINQIVRLVRKEGLDYEGWRYVAKQVRKLCDLDPSKRAGVCLAFSTPTTSGSSTSS